MMPAPTWTYDYDWTKARDRIRRLVQDVDATDKLAYDEEIAAEISADGDDQSEAADYLSASKVARFLSLKFARQVNSVKSGDDSIDFGSASNRAKFFWDLHLTLGAQATSATAPRPFLGGQSISQKQTTEANTDRVSPFFRRDDPYDRSERYGDWP